MNYGVWRTICRRIKRSLIVAGLVLISAVAGSSFPQAPRARLTLLVPAYFYPAGEGLKEWDRLLRSPGLNRVTVIVNPASGPGTASDSNYGRLLERIGKTALTPIGYVSTSYGRRSLNEVKLDVDGWLRLYPSIEGVFFDEQNSAASFADYYRELYDYVRKTKRMSLSINNPGTLCDETFFARPCADSICIYEGKGRPGASNDPAWSRKYASGTKCILPYGVGTSRAMKQTLKAAVETGIGRIYITDAAGANPWRRLPRYWEDEVAELMRLNHE